MKWLRLCAVAVLFLSSACSTDGEQKNPLEKVAGHLRELRSGILELRVIARESPVDPVIGGFELVGSFQAAARGELPVVDFRYRDLVSEIGGGRFISTGEAAFIVKRGRAYRLPGRETRWLRPPGEELLFEDFDLQQWMDNPAVESGEGLDAVDVERATGSVDVVEATHDLASLSARLGRPVMFEPLTGTESQQLRDSTELARAEVISGVDDGQLRRLLLEVELKDDEYPFAGALAGVGAGTFTFDLSLSEPNVPVQVEPPPKPLPFTALDPAERRRGGWL